MRNTGARARGANALPLTAVAIGAAMLLAACGDGGSSSTGPSDDVAGLFDVGGGRRMYLECHGTGSPTVVLISGGYEAGWIWSYALYPTDAVHDEPVDGFSAGRGDPHTLASAVLPTLGGLTRVCTYDRPNTTLGADIESERHGRDLHAGRAAASRRRRRRRSARPAQRRRRAGAVRAGRPLVRWSDRRALRQHLSARTSSVGCNVDVTSVFLRDTLPAADYQALIEANSVPPQPGAEAIELGEAIDLISEVDPAPLMPAIVLAADKPADLEPDTVERARHLLEAQRLLARHLCAKLLTRTQQRAPHPRRAAAERQRRGA